MTQSEAPLPAGLLLAAGASQRLGQAKQLVRYRGEPLVRRAASHLLSLGLPWVGVVTGSGAEAVETALRPLPVQPVRNENWSAGMGASIACGVRALGAAHGAVLIMLCDQWRLSRSDLETLVAAWQIDISQIVAAEYKAKNVMTESPPVIFPGSVFHELENMDPAAGAKQVIRENRPIFHSLPLPNAAFDLDTPADLRLLRMAEKSD